MTMTGYNELYLNDARKNLGEMIELLLLIWAMNLMNFLITS